MLRSLIVGLGLMLAAPAAWADAPADCGQHQDAERRIRGCTQLIQQVSQQNPRHPDLFKIYHNRGLAYWKKGQLDSAIPDYSKAIELNPREQSLLYDRGTLFLLKRQYDSAVKDYDKVLALNPRHANAYFNRGAAYVDKGQYDRAIQDFTKTIEIEPREAKGYYNRGNAYLKSKQIDRAIPDYNKTIELAPKMAAAYNNRGLAYESGGRKQEAIADLRKAIALEPNNKGSQDALKRLQTPTPAASDPAAAEFCSKAKEQAKCLSTRALLAQIKKDKNAARWSKDVDFKYAQNAEEQALLFELMLKNIPPAQQTKK